MSNFPSSRAIMRNAVNRYFSATHQHGHSVLSRGARGKVMAGLLLDEPTPDRMQAAAALFEAALSMFGVDDDGWREALKVAKLDRDRALAAEGRRVKGHRSMVVVNGGSVYQ